MMSTPTLCTVAEIAYKSTLLEWSDLSVSSLLTLLSKDSDGDGEKEGDESLRFNTHASEFVLASFLIRILAILRKRNDGGGIKENPTATSNSDQIEGETSSNGGAIPNFPDPSTSTICQTLLASRDMKGNCVQEQYDLSHEGNECKDIDEDIRSKKMSLNWPTSITDQIIRQLDDYIKKIFDMYRSVSYHNREHAFHVFITANKMLDQVLCEYDWTRRISTTPIKKPIRPTYGIKSDPILQLAFLFAALVHDVDHKGITNRQLIRESDELAIMYNDQSCAEQRSLAVAFSLLMKKEYQELRELIFYNDEEYKWFRKTVIDLVLCTDIASPERVQIVKSKWKEAFGEKGRPSLQVKADNDPNDADIEVSANEEGGSTSIQKNHSRRSRRPCLKHQTSVEFDDDWNEKSSNESMRHHSRKWKLRRLFFRKRSRRSSKSKKKKLHGKNEGVDSSVEEIARSRIIRSRSQYDSKSNLVPLSAHEQGTKSDSKKTLHKIKDYLLQYEDDISIDSEEETSGASFLENSGLKVGTNIKKNLRRTKSWKENSAKQDGKKNGNSSKQEQVGGGGQGFSLRSGSLEEKAKKLNKEFRHSENRTGIVRSNSGHEALEESIHSYYRRHSLRSSFRRFTEPTSIHDRKRFHLRLGIRRALDLSGSQIALYEPPLRSSDSKRNDVDKPDELKAIVVLEQLLKAADVSANSQSWETMILWCKRLFFEQKECFEEGRGENPEFGWHENQMSFFESYSMPLVCRLVETRVFEMDVIGSLINGVRRNYIRWMIDGKETTENMVRDWNEEEKRNKMEISI